MLLMQISTYLSEITFFLLSFDHVKEKMNDIFSPGRGKCIGKKFGQFM